MCGILGEVSFCSGAVCGVPGLVHHRGPDASGEVLLEEGRLWLGHTRLAIIDPSAAGAQPMKDPATGNVIVYNGELYNHLELRRELEEGALWRGSSDTETLLAAFREWGVDAFRRLRGMYAFGLWEAGARRLWLVRDPLGIKPLYWRRIDGGVRFASETRCLRTGGGRSEDLLSKEALAFFLRYGAFAEPILGTAGIETAPPGGWLRWDAEGRLERDVFWRPPADQLEVSPAEAVAGVRERVERAVERHLLADVPVAAFLSGGIDSSIVTMVAQRFSSRPLQTFSVGFRDAAWDESTVAAEVADRAGTEHTRIELDEVETLERVVAAVAAMDLPTVDGVNTFVVSEAVRRRGVKVALSGLGGDEFFGGYPIFREYARWRRLALMPGWTGVLLRLAGKHGRRLAELPGGEANPAAIADWRRQFFADRELTAMGLPIPRAAPVESPLHDWMAELSWAEAARYMRHVLLRDSDQMSMAHSLELRVPLLDLDLVEWVLRLPAALKMVGEFNKPLLVAAFREELPKNVYSRRKRGFELPLDRWLRGPLAEFAADGAQHLAERRPELIPAIERQRAAFASGRAHWTRWWTFVVLGHWLARVQR